MIGMVIALATVGMLVFVGANEDSRMLRQEQSHRAQSIETGADLYEIHCLSCHGAKGQGLGEMGPPLNDEELFNGKRLAEVGWTGTLEDYIAVTVSLGRLVATRPLYAGEGGVEAMTAWSQKYGGPLREDEIQDVAAFVMNWEATALGEVELQEVAAPTPSAAEMADAVTRGEQIFLEEGCADCHAIEGLSEADIGPDLTNIGQVAAERKPELSAEAYLRESFLIPGAYIVEGYEPETVGRRCGGVLSEPQLDDVVAFLLAQQ